MADSVEKAGYCGAEGSVIQSVLLAGLKIMMGHRQVEQAALFYEFSLEKHIPGDHLLRSIDRFVDLQEIRRDLAAFYVSIGRPSIDPELMIRMLLIDYCFGIRSEQRLCDGKAGLRRVCSVCRRNVARKSPSFLMEIFHRPFCVIEIFET